MTRNQWQCHNLWAAGAKARAPEFYRGASHIRLPSYFWGTGKHTMEGPKILKNRSQETTIHGKIKKSAMNRSHYKSTSDWKEQIA
jgi:hypothetical protein